MGACDRVGAEDELQRRGATGRPDTGFGQRERLLHRGEADGVVVPDALEADLVVQVVVEHQPALRIEERAIAHEHGARDVIGEHAMLHLRAAIARRTLHRLGGVRVHHRAKPLRGRFAAGRRKLRVRHRRLATVTDGLRCEDLDHIGTRGLEAPDDCAQRVRAAAGRALVHGAERRQHARTRNGAAVDGVAECAVVFLTDALHGGEAGMQRRPCVAGLAVRLRGGRIAIGLGVQPVLRVHVPANVHMRVDESRQHRARPEVDTVCRQRTAGRANRRDAPIADGDVGVGEQLARAVDDTRGAQHHGASRLRRCNMRRKREQQCERDGTCEAACGDRRHEHAPGRA